MLVDTHCHLNSLSPAQKQGCLSSCSKGFILVDSSIDYASSLKSLELSGSYSFVYSSLGFHPFCAQDFRPELIKEYSTLIKKNKKVIAIGEVGLDCKADISLKEQEQVLRVFIKLAKDNNLAVSIHNRLDSFQILKVFDEFFPSYESVVFHCFSYSEEFLKEILRRKGNISFSLNILRNKPLITASLKACPLENLLLETDSPYMKVDNKPSSPLNIKEVYSFAASVKGIGQEQLEQAVYSNFKRVFLKQ